MRAGLSAYRRGTAVSATLLYLAVALILMLPELAVGLIWTDSARFNLVWISGFTDAVLRGVAYPRWLAGTFDGFGSPTFYFYPPLFFYVAAVFRLLSAGALPAATAGSLASATLLVASGVAMRAWLRSLGAAPRVALLAGAAYVAAPFHWNEIYWRGALAEASVYPILPALLLAIDRVAAGRRRWVAGLAFGYAALLFAHLPLAPLASLTLLPGYAVFRMARSPQLLGSTLDIAVAVLLGAGIAAIYLWPAVRLMRASSQSPLQGAYLAPDLWFFSRWQDWPSGRRMVSVVLLAFGYLAIASAYAPGFRRLSPDARFWTVSVVVGVLLIAGVPAAFWHLPMVARVQFPWRLLPLVELSAIALVVAAGPVRLGTIPRALATIQVVAGIAATVAGAWRPIRAAFKGRAVPPHYRTALRGDAPEYLPAGFAVVRSSAGYPDPDRIALPLPFPPAVVGTGTVSVLRQYEGGGMRLVADVPVATTVTVRRFYFPSWRVSAIGAGATTPFAASRTRLLSWRVPAGRSEWTIAPGPDPVETSAGFASLMSLALLTSYLASIGLMRRRGRGVA